MLSIRIVAAGALISVITAGSAMAQTATDTGAGKPIQLLQVATQPDKTKSRPHAKRIMKIGPRPNGPADGTALQLKGRSTSLRPPSPQHRQPLQRRLLMCGQTQLPLPRLLPSRRPHRNRRPRRPSPSSQRRANSWSEAKPCTSFPRTMPTKSIALPTRRLFRQLRQSRALSLRQRRRRIPQPLPWRTSRRAMSAPRPGSRRSWRRSVARSRPVPPPGS